ncbi:MAG: DNA repair protein RecO [Oscillospiraceae bacterium]
MKDAVTFVTRGLILRETPTKEADKILTVLTAELGKIGVIARGVRRKSCKYAAAAQLLTYAELTLYHRKDWFLLDDGTTVEQFAGLRQDLELLALGSYFAELTEAVTHAEVPAPESLPLLLNALYALEKLHRPPALVKAAFELRLMRIAGYEPLVDGCVVCGAGEPREPRLDVRQGVLRCRACGEKGEGLSLPLDDGSLAALRHAVHGDPKRLYSFALDGAALGRLSAAAEAFCMAQMERDFRTLDYYKLIKLPDLP